MYLLSLFGEYFIATALQDLNEKTIPITLSHEKFVETFKNAGGEELTLLGSLEGESLIDAYYTPVLSSLQ